MSEVVHITNTTEVAPVDDGLGSGFEGARLKPSFLKIVQNSTQDPKGAKPGQFLNQLTEEAIDKITVIPLLQWSSRAKFPKDEFTKPICKSPDGIKPADYVEAPLAPFCKVCQYSKWDNVAKRFPCPESRELLFLDDSTELPHRITFRGMSVGVWKQIYDGLYTESMKLKKQTGASYRLFDFKITLTTERSVTKSGITYLLKKVGKVEPIDQPGKYADLVRMLTERKDALTEEEESYVQNESTVNQAVEEVLEAVEV